MSDKQYTVDEWKGLPRYACNLCPYDSLHEQRVIEHIARDHAPKVRAPLVQPFDEQGRPIDATIVEADTTGDDGSQE